MPFHDRYACYTFLERLGVRFRIDGDVVDDARVRASAPGALLRAAFPRGGGPDRVTLTPSFDRRGLQPFHDFSAGPDWWNEQARRFCGLFSIGRPAFTAMAWILIPSVLLCHSTSRSTG